MRKTALVMTFLFLVACVCIAGDESQATNKDAGASSLSNSATPAVKTQLESPMSKPESRTQAASVPERLREYRAFETIDPRERVCLKMRSYIVARESRHSDSTRLVGYKTCQPSWKYELRTTVGTIEDSRR